MSRISLVMWRMIVFAMVYAALIAASDKVHAAIPVSLAEDSFSVEVTGITENIEPNEKELDDILQVEVIRDKKNPAYAGKRILIYHTHTYEAYEQSDAGQYREIEKWRTADSNHNVVAVGKALAASLSALGIEVQHDTTAFEPPTLEDAYERSLAMLEERLASGERYDLYIDLHRDALASTASIKRTVSIGGIETARFMVLVGKGTTGGYTVKPDWEKNYEFALRITESLNAQCQHLARDVKVKTGRFNQHIADGCILIECGMNSNTLDEVLAGIPYLAQSIAESLLPPTETAP